MNNMEKLNYRELKTIEGGETISGTLINAFVSGIKAVLEVGRSFGTAIRRIKDKQLCEIP